MYVRRELEKQIQPFLKRREALAVIGPRQAGKTTFLQHLLQKMQSAGSRVKYLTFESRKDLNLFQEDPEDFLELHKTYDTIIIDEFQYAKEGGKKLKYLYDISGKKFIISGSSSLELTFQTGKYMVGRLLSFELFPFSFREYLSFADPDLYRLLTERFPVSALVDIEKAKPFSNEINRRLERHFEKYSIWGGYPAVALSSTDEERRKIAESLFDQYLMKDIRTLLQLATGEQLQLLVKSLALQIGNLIQYKELSTISGLKYPSLRKHLDILGSTYILDQIRPFFRNKRTELTKNPKVYFLDTGMRNAILSDFRTFDKRNGVGQLAENYVYSVLHRNESTFRPVNFWRTKSKAEVDFVISEEPPLPIEVRYSLSPGVGKSLHSFIDKFNPGKAIILTRKTFAVEEAKGCKIYFLPIYYF